MLAAYLQKKHMPLFEFLKSRTREKIILNQFERMVNVVILGLMDYKNSIIRKMINADKADPGAISFLEPGWWILHATAITGIYLLASRMAKRS